MKRKLTLVVCVIAVIAMVLSLASCGGDDHSHTYDTTKWSSNEYGHWYAATCDCEGETSNYGAHVDADKNGVCDTCKYVVCEHQYETEWQSDETKHWNNSSCGCNVKGSYEDHVDENKDGNCDTCAYVVCAHTYETEWSIDGENHWYAASCGCDVVSDKAAHVDTVFDGVCDICAAVICKHVDANKDGICDDCTYVKCAHEYDTKWLHDDKNHWHAPICGCEVANKDVAAHVDANKDGNCDVCNYVVCAHTYDKTKYETSGSHHWYAPTCGCEVKGSYDIHEDADENKLCDVCGENICDHTYSDTKTWDETAHWYPATCGCDMKKDYEEHTWATEWSSDEDNHWYAATCGCEVTKSLAAHDDTEFDGVCDVCAYVICAHADEDKDGICDDCTYVMCTHTFATEYTKNEKYHWHVATCGCLVVDGKAEHDAAECTACGYKSVVGGTIENLDSEASLNTNSTESVKDKGATNSYTSSYTYVVLEDGRLSLYNQYGEEQYMYVTLTDGVPTLIDDVYGAGECVISPVEGRENVYSYTAGIYTYYITVYADSNYVDVETSWSMEKDSYYKVYDNYIVVSDIYGNVKYYSYYGTNGELLFVMTVDEYGYVNREADAVEPGAIAEYSAVNWNVSATNHEDFIKGLYNLGVNGTTDWEGNFYPSYGFVGAENEGVYSFSYLFVESGSYFVVEVSFTVDGEVNGVATANVSIAQYGEGDVEVNAMLDTYTVAEGAEATSTETYDITQAFGDPMDSTDAPNPYPASNYIVDEYTITLNGEAVNDGDTIEVEANEDVVFNFGADVLDLIKYNTITVSATYGDGETLPDYWNTIGEVSVNRYNDERPITFTGKIADIFVIVIDVEGVEMTVNVKVNYKTPTYISSVVYDADDNKQTVSEWTMYMGQTLKIAASVETGCNPAFVATLPQGVAAALTDNEDGTYTFMPVMVGTYEITITSAVADTVSTVLTVTVEEAPAISDVLNGTHSGSNMYSGLDASAVFTPSAEDATNGTVVISINGEVFSYITWTYETVALSATYNYAYNEETEAIDLTYVSGDQLMMLELTLKNYKVVLIYEGYDYKLAQEVEEPETPAGDATEGPITVTMTDAYTYCYNYIFTFVAGEAGFYQFTVPAGFGIISDAEYQNYGQPYVDFNENGGTFVLELEAGEVLNWRFGSLEATEYSVEFEYSVTGFDSTTETYVVVNENATPSEITVTVDPNGTITFTYTHPMTGLETSSSYDYEIVEGVMTLYFQGEAVAAEEAAVTLVDGAVVSVVFFDNEYLVKAKDDNEEGTVAITGDGSETNPFVIVGAGSTLISASKWQPLFVQVKAGVTVTLPAGAQFYTDPTDMESVVGATVTPNIDKLYYVYADSRAGCMGMLTATVSGGNSGNEITGSGTENDPFVLPSVGDYVCAFPGGYTPIWYVYTAEADGTLTVSSTYADAWLGAAADAMTANNTHNEGMGSITISVTAGTTYYIMVGDWMEAAMDVPFTITVA